MEVAQTYGCLELFKKLSKTQREEAIAMLIKCLEGTGEMEVFLNFIVTYLSAEKSVPSTENRIKVKKKSSKRKKCDAEISIKNEVNEDNDDESMAIDVVMPKSSKFDWDCHVCNLSFNTRGKLRDHRREVKCNKRLVRENNQKSRILKVSELITSYTKSGEIYSCTYCNMTQTKERDLQKHIQRVHFKDSYTVNCELCGKGFFKDYIKTHVKVVHTKEIRYNCDLCDFGCFGKQSLNRHKSKKHENLKFFCKICSFESSDRANVRRHERVHSDERNFSCDICFKQFKEKRKLKAHFQNIHGNEKHLCGTCGKEFPSKEYLKTHEKHHKTDLLLCCSYCGKGFITSQKLNEHVNIHTGDKPFSCPLSRCDKSFPSGSALAHHKKKCEHLKIYKM